jgi:hypothetical protein
MNTEIITAAKQLARQNQQLGCGECDWRVIAQDLIDQRNELIPKNPIIGVRRRPLKTKTE